MKKYQIYVDGCDDDTTIYEDLTEEEYEFLNKIAQKITKTSRSRCMPRMTITEFDSRYMSIDHYNYEEE